MKMRLTIFSTCVLLLAACSGSDSPQLIAAQPVEEAIATYPNPLPPPGQVILNATMELDVAHVDHAADRTKGIAFEHGGYLVKAQSWYQGGEKHTMIILAVPADHFEAAHVELLRLGILVSESISGDLIDRDGSQWMVYSQITVYLRPQVKTTPYFSISKRQPLVTLAKAWDVFLCIFGFILDIFIWFAVVGGPFLLMGWIGVAFIKRRRRNRKQEP